MARCLVTGGAGFIGSNLVRGLLRESHEVVVLDNLSTGVLANLTDIAKQIRFVEGDVRNRELMANCCRGVEYVFHQAALASVPQSVDDPWTNNEINVNGTLSVLLAARDSGVSRVVFAASSSAYGDSEELPKRESMPPLPQSPYAVAKYVGELYCQMFHGLYGVETVALRYFNVFGPRQNPRSEYAAVIPRFITKLLKGEPPMIFGDGEQTRDFVFIKDVVQANLRAAMAPAKLASGKVFNIGSGERISLNSLVTEMQAVLGTHLQPLYALARVGDVRDSQGAISHARQALGYEPAVGMREGLRETIQWYAGTNPKSQPAHQEPVLASA